MSPSPVPPARFRYLKARLRPLTKPIFWGSITVLSLGGALTWAYFNHPEWLALTDNQQNSLNADNQPDISQEDQSIGADIDRLWVLEKDIAEVDPIQVIPNTSSKQNTFLDEVMKKRQDGESNKLPSLSVDKLLSEQSIANPFAIKNSNLSGTSGISSSGRPSPENYANPMGETAPNGVGNFHLPTSANQNSGAATVSPLQSALDRNTTGNSSSRRILNRNNKPVSPLESAIDRDSANQSKNIQNSDTASVSPLQSALEENTTSNFTGTSKQTIAETLGQASTQSSQQDPSGRLTPTEPYPGTPAQTATPAYPYQSLPSYSPLPGQGYTPSPYPIPGATSYNVPYGTNNPVNSYTYLNQPQVPTIVAPTVQVNPSVTNVTPNNLGQSPFQSATPSTGYSNPGFNPNAVNSGLQPYQMQTPSNFSIPRSVPGRYIGGGRINTFSNP